MALARVVVVGVAVGTRLQRPAKSRGLQHFGFWQASPLDQFSQNNVRIFQILQYCIRVSRRPLLHRLVSVCVKWGAGISIPAFLVNDRLQAFTHKALQPMFCTPTTWRAAVVHMAFDLVPMRESGYLIAVGKEFVRPFVFGTLRMP